MTARRAPYGSGSIYYDTSKGVWRQAVSLPDGRRRRYQAPKAVRTKKQAAEFFRSRATRLGGTGARMDMTVAQLCEWWLDTRAARVERGELAPNTLLNDRWALRSVIDRLGKIHLDHLEPDNVEWLLNELAQHLRIEPLKRVRSTFAQVLDVALRRGQVVRNAARLAELPKAKPAKPRRSLTVAQAHQLLEAAAGHRLEAMLILGLMLGLRPGEVLGITWDNVDLEAGTVTVRRSLTRTPRLSDGQIEAHRLGTVKGDNPRARRTLALPARAIPALAARRTAQKAEQLACGLLWEGNRDRLVFTSLVGGPLTHGAATGELARLTSVIGLGTWSLTELFRRSAASIMGDAGMSNEAIAEVYGHATTRMLERHYRVQIRPAIAHHIAVMDTVFSQNSP